MVRRTSTLSSNRPQDYKAVLGRFCTGVTVVTALDGDTPVGFTCQSFSALSLQPPLILICPSKGSTTWPRISRAGAFAVNILAAGQEGLGRGFARSGADKFAGVEWRPSPAGLPLLPDTLAWLECSIADERDAGDHTVVIATVDELGHGPADEPLLFYRGGFRTLNPKDATI
jgi:3-hydroxy-9,10-secoandrosta-1,3,5(10)-triene-9,17-dione monooxygenase reductase component